MTNIILCGCQGFMGKTITELVHQRDDINILAGVDIKNDLSTTYPIYNNILNVNEKADVVIDFSHPSLLKDILNYCKSNHTPVVLATTGYSDEDISLIKDFSSDIPLFFTYNMSLGINLITELAVRAKTFLGDTFDVEIIEKHHNKKIDAPSGTAIMLANALSDDSTEFVYDRHSVKKARTKNEIGISSLRGGTIVGEHSVIFAGNDEIVEIKHTAFSKKVFATGAVNAAIWLKDKPQGLYSMKDIV